MKTFLEWMIKALTGALAVGIFLGAASSRVSPLTVPLQTVGGRKRVLNLPDAVGLIVFVCLAAAILIYHCPWCVESDELLMVEILMIMVT
jgi:hypothetical protein